MEATTPKRRITQVGWDGRSQPMWRYTDELDRPDYARSVVKAEDLPR
jgi:hypothetical protein